ncbi:MAG: pilus assembly protein [Anaerolineales bacterium]|nr:pilus assembly protein [Anaerolineales bacterium]
MRIKNLSSSDKRLSAQSMVEFALVLPVVMLMVFGLIEAGRLLFIYSSITTASRQAVRYGSATGDNGSGIPKYLDCTGIQGAAQRMGILLPIDTVDITYTRNGNTIADCNTSDNTYPSPSASDLQNGDRIEVTTVGHYEPMVPMGAFATFPIVTGSKRTIFVGITIKVQE